MANLFSSLIIKDIKMKNRIVMPPMALELATESGEVTEKMIAHYQEKASGGVGLIIIEHSYVLEQGRYSKRQLGSYDKRLLPGLSKLAGAIQRYETPVVLQINHAGPRGSSQISGTTPLSPSSIKVYDDHEVPKEITKDQIETVKGAFAQAALLAKNAGFNGVEIHGAHGFLLSAFLSPLANKRKDEYGGSLENRAKLPLEIIRIVREAIGDSFPLFFRLGADDMRPGGLEVNESKTIAGWLADAGVDVIDVSGGLVGSRPSNRPPGYFVKQAHEIKKQVNVPVIAVGGITEPSMAEEIIQTGMADLVAIGRALLKDPLWPQKAANLS